MEALAFFKGRKKADFIKRIKFLNSSKTTKDFHFSGEWGLMVQKSSIIVRWGWDSPFSHTHVLLPITQQASFLPHGTLARSLSDKAGAWQQQEEKGKRNKRIWRKDKFDIHIIQEKRFVVVCFEGGFCFFVILDKIVFSYHSDMTWQLAEVDQKKG